MKIRSFITKSRAGHYSVTVYLEGQNYPHQVIGYIDNIERARQLLELIKAAALRGERYEGCY